MSAASQPHTDGSDPTATSSGSRHPVDSADSQTGSRAKSGREPIGQKVGIYKTRSAASLPMLTRPSEWSVMGWRWKLRAPYGQ